MERARVFLVLLAGHADAMSTRCLTVEERVARGVENWLEDMDEGEKTRMDTDWKAGKAERQPQK